MLDLHRNTKKYDFNSVGKKQVDRIKKASEVFAPTPIGIATPLRFDNNSLDSFDTNTDLLKQIRDNFKNMIATNHGERLNLHDFGGNLLPLLFELGNAEADEIAISQISETTKKYMPFISLQTFQVDTLGNDGNGNANIRISIIFSIPSLSSEEQMVELNMKFGG